ncbi:DNA-binding protein [Loigolactobacillus backii]|uniref:DNA-binding protein n=1 Tax=Loigolactobacillus backii TaxID=375175 RepID=UPI000C1CACB6|nr:DNA-binding protein [Loigolactobacillus backii]PIO84404.1 DNA-binding protein [Loigolactobacillus backii]
MKSQSERSQPLLLNRQQAADFLGIDPVSFDRYFRHSDDLPRFMVGRQERFLPEELVYFVKTRSA